MKDTMISIADRLIITNQSTMMITIIKAEERKTQEGKVIIITKILVQCLLPDHVQDIQNILPPDIPRKTLKEKNQNTIHNKINKKIILKVNGHLQMR